MRLSDNFACMNLFVSFLFVLASFVVSGLFIRIVVIFAMVVANLSIEIVLVGFVMFFIVSLLKQ